MSSSSEKDCERIGYCWVRLIDADADGSDADLSVLAQVQACKPLFLAGGRPPRALVAAASGAVTSSGLPSTTMALSKMTWSIDLEFSGRPDSPMVIDYGPAFIDRDDAVSWLLGQNGQAWIAESRNHLLLVVRQCDDVTPYPKAPEIPGWDNGANTPERHRFDWCDWVRSAGQRHLPLRNPSELLVNIDRIPLGLPPAHENTGEECDDLEQLQSRRTAQQERSIVVQSQSHVHAILPVLEASSLGQTGFETPEGRFLIEWVTDSVDPVVFLHKRWFMRARPQRQCPALRPLLMPPSRLHPGHPSYPSGHAAHAWVWAELLARRNGGRRERLEAAAQQVAHNREIAGVHFPSDSRAGAELAAVLVDHMLDPARNPNHPEFERRLTQMGL